MTMQRRTKPALSGFTLVELLVVIAIIGVLIALLLPAVQAAREAARRMSCMNQMKNLGLGVHLFHETHSEFPGAGEDRGRRDHSWMTLILPYVEEQSLYDLYDFELKWNQGNNGRKVCKSTLSNLSIQLCPSTEPPESALSYGRGDYAAIIGPARYSGNGAAETRVTNSGGYAIDDGYARGQAWAMGALVFISPKDKPDVLKNRRTRMSDITDGTSQTVMLGECAGRDVNNHSTSLDSSMYWCNCEHAFAQHEEVFNFTPNNELYSDHPGGLMICLADASVHFMKEDIQKSVYDNFTTRSFEDLTDYQF